MEAQLDRQINGVGYRVVFEPEPFDRGACRLAFRGVYHGGGDFNGKQCVVKVFKEAARRHYENYQPDIRASQKANEFAEKFNAYFRSTKPIRFIVPELATVTGVTGRSTYARPRDKILVEDFIEGNYEKFSNNADYQTDRVAAVRAFSHFTYSESGGAYLVCDIQGVRTPNGYTLTDPAVHSRTYGAYGPTDLGPAGMARFFAAHVCTSVCSQFLGPQYNAKVKINGGRTDRRASTYTFQLADNELAANRFYANRRDLPAVIDEQEPEQMQQEEGTSMTVIGALAAAAAATATVLGVALLRK